MKKTRDKDWPKYGNTWQMMLIFKKIFVLLFFCTCLILPLSGYSQQKTTVTLDMKDVTLNEVIIELKKQTDYEFFYNSEMVQSKGKVTVQATNKEVKAVLDEILPKLGLEYSIQQNLITIREKSNKIQSIIVSGKVVDEKRNPLPGVTVTIKGTRLGVTTDINGKYTISIPNGENLVLVFSFVGMKTREIPCKRDQEILDVILSEDIQAVDEVVVNGIFTRKAESFTGAAKTFRKEELKRVGNTNIFQSLKNLDPSLRILEDRTMGSDPNSLPDMRLRGTSSFPGETGDGSLKGNYQSQPNQPLFILDGFETSVETVFDLDMNRVESITILKDAASKAIYGSKAANGVVVIETIGLGVDGYQASYSGNIDIEMPDLTSYNLCNAEEKLAVEVLEGSVYPNTPAGMKNYYERLKKVREGLDTYWLSKPLRVGVGQRHTFSFETGTKELRTLFSISYNNVAGVMKDSYRENLSGNVQLTYRKSNLLFRDVATITRNKTQDSPYGTFSNYANANPYAEPYDKNGKPNRTIPAGGTSVNSPLYNANTNVKDQTSYLSFTNNFYIEWTILEGLKATGRVSVTTKRSDADEYYPRDHTSQTHYSGEDSYKAGSYTLNTGKGDNLSFDVYLNYTRNWGKHNVFGNVGWSISENKSMEIVNKAQGYKTSEMDEYAFGFMYEIDGKPRGSSSTNRNVGVTGVFSYTYDDRFLLDATVRGSAASVFGTDNPWGTFWSVGLGWNVHHEKFMENLPFITNLKIRGSIGTTGNQNFQSNKANANYLFYMTENYQNRWAGAYLSNMENPGLKWEKKKDYNIGFDLGTKLVSLRFEWYLAQTENLVSSISIPASTGFTSVSENLGLVENKGLEVELGIRAINHKNGFLNINASIATNNNKLKKLSDAMRDFNNAQMQLAADENRTAPVQMYYDGVHMNTIWAVPSLGIDPADGYEVYLNKEGMLTKQWKASDMIAAGVADPKYNGNFGLNGEYKGIGISIVFTFQGGGELYNQTLVDRVENVNINDNVDRRVLTGRWQRRGQLSQFRRIQNSNSYIMGNMGEPARTRSTTRFVQKDNELNLSSLSVYYDFPAHWLKACGIERLKLQGNMNDIYKWSSIQIERGTSYPFARTLSLSLTATF